MAGIGLVAQGEGGGRPTKYKSEYAKQAKKLCELGATDKQLADFFEVSLSTISLWKVTHQRFSEALKLGKTISDDMVERALYQRAMGYSHEDTDIKSVNGEIVITPTIKHYPPDTTAMIFWLKNRRPESWREKPDGDDSDESPPLNISFTVNEAVKDIKVTNAKS